MPGTLWITTWPVSAVQSKGSTGSMIGGSGSFRAKIARTKSSPDIDAITDSGVTPYSIFGVELSIMRGPRAYARFFARIRSANRLNR